MPPDPHADRRQRGPLVLLLVGSIACFAVYGLRDRLRPARAEGEPPRPSILSITPATRPSANRAAASPTSAASAAWVDPFGSVSDEAAAASRAPLRAPVEASSSLRLQSVVIGARSRTCIINGKAYAVGDDVDGAVVRVIGRDAVTLRRDGRDERLTLPVGRVGAGSTARPR